MTATRMSREHWVSLAVSKHAFIHPRHGITISNYPLRTDDAEALGLEPLMLYGVTVAQTPIRLTMYSTLGNIKPIMEVLNEAWAKAPGLKGIPDKVVVSRKVYAESDDRLGRTLAEANVEFGQAEKGDKVFPRALVNCQEETDILYLRDRRMATISDLNEAARARHLFYVCNEWWRHGDCKEEAKAFCNEWIKLPEKKGHIGAADPSMDWTPGDWLLSWVANTPPFGEAHIEFDKNHNTSYVCTGPPTERYFFEDEDDEEEYEEQCEREYENYFGSYDNLFEVAKNLIDSLPIKLSELAQMIGSSTKDLSWFLKGENTEENISRGRLRELLNIGFEEGEYEAKGSLVFVANNPSATKRTYNEITRKNWDDCYAFEAVPERAAADPSWRYIVFCHNIWPCIFMVQRGSKVAEKLNDNMFENFIGCETVTDQFYSDIVSTAARACKNYGNAVELVREFYFRSERIFKNIEDEIYKRKHYSGKGSWGFSETPFNELGCQRSEK